MSRGPRRSRTEPAPTAGIMIRASGGPRTRRAAARPARGDAGPDAIWAGLVRGGSPTPTTRCTSGRPQIVTGHGPRRPPAGPDRDLAGRRWREEGPTRRWPWSIEGPVPAPGHAATVCEKVDRRRCRGSSSMPDEDQVRTDARATVTAVTDGRVRADPAVNRARRSGGSQRQQDADSPGCRRGRPTSRARPDGARVQPGVARRYTRLATCATKMNQGATATVA